MESGDSLYTYFYNNLNFKITSIISVETFLYVYA